jgi:hypothetical protein
VLQQSSVCTPTQGLFSLLSKADAASDGGNVEKEEAEEKPKQYDKTGAGAVDVSDVDVDW